MSLNETLICDLFCVKFKIRIVTNAAIYWIKTDIVTDVKTISILMENIYTGNKPTFHFNIRSSFSKLLSTPARLCEGTSL